MTGPSIKSLQPGTLSWDMALRLFLLRCKAQNIAPSTQELYGFKLRSFVRWAVENGAASIDTRDLLGLRDHALILFLADTGLRISEALSVRIGDVDWTSGSITVMGKGAPAPWTSSARCLGKCGGCGSSEACHAQEIEAFCSCVDPDGAFSAWCVV
ncbi:MAG TPA: hypothetical protein DEB40_10190 [Elusimicrobia bacterium]|nr:hypothetical protein [Elusimicrobiota bacterium]HBT62099.1 hypothetical protein [Elusimicrobiota bacterium]